jgi:diguanylate cyclase (GGDEF)-like protein
MAQVVSPRSLVRPLLVVALLVAALGLLEQGLAGRERDVRAAEARGRVASDVGRDLALLRGAVLTARLAPDRAPRLARSVRGRGKRMRAALVAGGADASTLALLDRTLVQADRELAAVRAGNLRRALAVELEHVTPGVTALSAIAALDASLARDVIDSSAPGTTAWRRALLIAVAALGTLAALLVVGPLGPLVGASASPAAGAAGRWHRRVVEQSSDAVLVIGADGAVRELAGAAPSLLPGLTVGERFAAAVHPEDRIALARRWTEVTAAPGNRLRAALRVRRGSGWVEVDAAGANLLHDKDVGGVVVTLRDTGERTRLERELRHLAYEDPLTGLGNRAALRERLDTLLAERGGQRTLVAVLFVDLDDFKAINDGFGHPVGDEVLRTVGRRIGSVVGAAGFVGRPGGDEFVVVAQVAAAEEARTLAEAVAAAVQQPLPVNGVELRVGASVGVAIQSPGDPGLGMDVMRRADIAMYVAKGEGGGVVEYRPEDDPQAADRLALLADLRHALRTGEQLELAVQPQVDVASGELRAVEALVRWHHPQRGVVPPDAFVSLAERSGLIAALTQRVLDLALQARAAWSAAGLEINIAVNLSASNLLDASFPTEVERLLAQHGAGGDMLCLELTETMLLADEGRAADVLEHLSRFGVELSIDDFGTGHSSLTRLRDLPLDELKVDRSFVAAMHADAEAAAIVRSTVHLAHELGLRVVAEGVELPEHLEALEAAGCDLAQGYLLARPMPAADLLAWAAERGAAAAGAA